jgi:hypothetical protein
MIFRASNDHIIGFERASAFQRSFGLFFSSGIPVRPVRQGK